MSDTAGTVGWFEDLIGHAYAAGASDVHLVPDVTARMRVDGRLVVAPPGEEPVPPARLEALARELFGPDALARLRTEGLVTRSIRVDLRPKGERWRGEDTGLVSGRVTLASSCGRPTLGFRFAVGGANELTPERLRLPPVVVETLLASDHGLILVAGGHESGKTTTLMSLAGWLVGHRPLHLCTVETPLAWLLRPTGPGLIQQREVGTDVPDVRTGIAAAMGQDLDALVVTEVPDLESLMALLHAAETGHLVLAQVHARSPAEALERLIEAAPDGLDATVRRSLAETLRGVIWQRLLPRQPRGRVAAYEVLVPDQAYLAGLEAGTAPGQLRPGSGSVGLSEQLHALEREGLVSAAAAAEARAAR